MVPESRFLDHVRHQRPGRLDLADPGRRAEVVGDAEAAPEAGDRDDLLVVDPLAAEARLVAMGNVPLAGDRAEPEIGRHGSPSGITDAPRCGCAESPAARRTAP